MCRKDGGLEREREEEGAFMLLASYDTSHVVQRRH
jgi:hypothetical protein